MPSSRIFVLHHPWSFSFDEGKQSYTQITQKITQGGGRYEQSFNQSMVSKHHQNSQNPPSRKLSHGRTNLLSEHTVGIVMNIQELHHVRMLAGPHALSNIHKQHGLVTAHGQSWMSSTMAKNAKIIKTAKGCKKTCKTNKSETQLKA